MGYGGSSDRSKGVAGALPGGRYLIARALPSHSHRIAFAAGRGNSWDGPGQPEDFPGGPWKGRGDVGLLSSGRGHVNAAGFLNGRSESLAPSLSESRHSPRSPPRNLAPYWGLWHASPNETSFRGPPMPCGEACYIRKNPRLDPYSQVRSTRRAMSHRSHRSSLPQRSTAVGRRPIAHVRPWRRGPKHCPAATESRAGVPPSILHALAARPPASMQFPSYPRGSQWLPTRACMPFLHMPMQLRKAREQMRGYPIAADGAGLEGVPQ